MGSVCSQTENQETDTIAVEPSQEKLRETPKAAVDEAAPAKPAKGPTVKVVMARGLRNADWSWIPGKGVSDAYVVVSVDGKEINRTGVIPNTLEPVFNEEIELLGDFGAAPEKIDFDLYDKDPGKPDDKLGRCSLSKEKYESGFNGEIPLEDAGEGIKAFLKVMVKQPDSEYPAGATNEFKVTLKKEKGGPIGFEVDDADPAMLFIYDGAFDGAAKVYNDKAESAVQLEKGQYIAEVNGVKGDTKKMMKEFKSKDELTLLVRRPMFFTIAVDKKGPFGLTLANAPSAAYVSKPVTGKESVISKWNAAHKDKEVKVGDRVVSVNSKQGSGKEITEMLKTDGSKQAVICRPCDPSFGEAFYYTFF